MNAEAWPDLHIRGVQEADLPSLEWDGELSHYRRLFYDAFLQTRQGTGLMWVGCLPTAGIVAQLFVQLNSQRNDLADGMLRAYIYGFRVRDAYRNRGIGTRLLNSAEQDLQRRGFSLITLNVGQDNPLARRLYERHGYTIIGPDPGRWSYVNQYGQIVQVNEPAWRMEKVLR